MGTHARVDWRPERIADATWQPGFTANGQTHRVTINGEPAPDCIAANDVVGWALLSWESRFGNPIRIYGNVQLVPVPRECR